jgi:hypothetical protein
LSGLFPLFRRLSHGAGAFFRPCLKSHHRDRFGSTQCRKKVLDKFI